MIRSRQILTVLVLAGLAGGGLWYAGRSGEAPSAAVDGGAPKTVRVEIAEAVVDTVSERVEAVGSTLARQAVDIVPLTSGRVAEIRFRPGEHVEQGEILVRLDDVAERAAVEEARAQLRETELALQRAKRLRANNNVAQATVDELEAAHDGARARVDRIQNELDQRVIQAPFPGIVGMRQVDVGARVDDESVLTTLDDLGEVEIEFAVPEDFYGQIRPGQTVAAASSAFEGRIFEGRIGTIDSRIDAVGRAFVVRAVLPNPDLTLPAGMFMHVRVILSERQAVLIPEEAAVAEAAATFVFRVEDGLARRVDVELGLREFGRVEVTEGLEAGDLVVVKGVHRLRDGMAVEVVVPADPTPTS